MLAWLRTFALFISVTLDHRALQFVLGDGREWHRLVLLKLPIQERVVSVGDKYSLSWTFALSVIPVNQGAKMGIVGVGDVFIT